MILPDWKDADIIEELCNVESGLTPFEEEFCDSISRQVLDEGRTLTSKQRRVAAKTFARLGIIDADELEDDDDE